MAASDAVSSWGPQPNDQPPPPIAQAPKPTRVISRSLDPSGCRERDWDTVLIAVLLAALTESAAARLVTPWPGWPVPTGPLPAGGDVEVPGANAAEAVRQRQERVSGIEDRRPALLVRLHRFFSAWTSGVNFRGRRDPAKS